jgi:hypothetical protein
MKELFTSPRKLTSTPLVALVAMTSGFDTVPSAVGSTVVKMPAPVAER